MKGSNSHSNHIRFIFGFQTHFEAVKFLYRSFGMQAP